MSSSPPKKQKFSHAKSKNYYKPSKRQFLEPGQRGFLATCNFREKDCIREAYNILNHYADELYGAPAKEPSPAPASGDAEDTGDIADDLQKEIAAANATKQNAKGAVKYRFQVVDTGTTNCVFIRTTLPEPVELGTRIVSEIARTREQKTRFLLRLVPVEVVCRANMTDITSAGGTLFDKHFLKQSSTFAIVFNKRYNNDVKREDVIRELAELVQSKNAGNRVDLKQAAKTVIVEIIKGLCCLSVVNEYLRFRKYNLLELANVKEEDGKTGEKEQAVKSVDEKESAEKADTAGTSQEVDKSEKEDAEQTIKAADESLEKEVAEKDSLGSNQDDEKNGDEVDAKKIDSIEKT